MPGAPSRHADELRERLRHAGQQRQQHTLSGESLAEEIRRLVSDAEGVISMAEMARLLEMDRSTLYRVYAEDAA